MEMGLGEREGRGGGGGFVSWERGRRGGGMGCTSPYPAQGRADSPGMDMGLGVELVI